MKTIYFVRHGESEANAAGLLAGKELDSPLTKLGEQQAKQIGKSLKDKQIKLIVSSPMGRARETAKIIANEINYAPQRIIVSELITERAYGKHSGTNYQNYVTESQKDRILLEGVESAAEIHERVKEAFKWLTKQTEDTILVVSHGGTGRMFRLVDRELSRDDFHTIERFGNCEVDEFTI